MTGALWQRGNQLYRSKTDYIKILTEEIPLNSYFLTFHPKKSVFNGYLQRVKKGSERGQKGVRKGSKRGHKGVINKMVNRQLLVECRNIFQDFCYLLYGHFLSLSGLLLCFSGIAAAKIPVSHCCRLPIMCLSCIQACNMTNVS